MATESPNYQIFAWYGYTDGTGETYPDYTYTRNLFYDISSGANSPGAWSPNSVTATTITLTRPWAGKELPIGTAVANHYFGGAFSYVPLSSQFVPNAATEYSATIGGAVSTTSHPSLFRPGTAFIKPVVLANYHGQSNNLITWEDVEVTYADSTTFRAGDHIDLHVNNFQQAFAGHDLTYQWTQTSGPAVTLTNSDQATASFTALTTLADHDLTFDVTVSDGATTRTDAVTVSVGRYGDVANELSLSSELNSETFVGAVAVAPVVFLNPVSYQWVQTGGPAVALSGANTRVATFTAPKQFVDYDLTFDLIVSDGVTSVADSVTVAVPHVDPQVRFRVETTDLRSRPTGSVVGCSGIVLRIRLALERHVADVAVGRRPSF